MKATELIGCAVYDADGTHLGNVHDLRLESAGRPEDGDWRCRLTGLVCGSTAVGHRLGYGVGDMAGPWLLAKLLSRQQRHRLTVPWQAVNRLDPGRISLRVSRASLEQP
jgi:hypothetical protein